MAKKERKITVPLNLIVDAVESADANWNQYLDIEKLEVISLPEEYNICGMEEDLKMYELIEEEWQVRFFALPSTFDIHEYSIMEKFIWSLPEGRIRDSLERAVRGRGAFRRFKDSIYRYGVEQDWYDFQYGEYKKNCQRMVQEIWI